MNTETALTPQQRTVYARMRTLALSRLHWKNGTYDQEFREMRFNTTSALHRLGLVKKNANGSYTFTEEGLDR